MSARRIDNPANPRRSGEEARRRAGAIERARSDNPVLKPSAPAAAGPLTTRRSRLLFGLAAALSLVGLADALYLTMQHLAGAYVRCAVLTGCSEVLGSQYATIAGFPVAGLGAVAYFTVFSLATLTAFGYAQVRSFLTITVALMLVFTLWLLFAQAFLLEAFCEFCLLSAAVTFSLAGLLLIERFSRAKKQDNKPQRT